MSSVGSVKQDPCLLSNDWRGMVDQDFLLLKLVSQEYLLSTTRQMRGDSDGIVITVVVRQRRTTAKKRWKTFMNVRNPSLLEKNGLVGKLVHDGTPNKSCVLA